MNVQNRGVVSYRSSLCQVAMGEQSCTVQRDGDASHDDVGRVGGPRERVVERVGDVSGV
jgi:hypothetical protein